MKAVFEAQLNNCLRFCFQSWEISIFSALDPAQYYFRRIQLNDTYRC